MARIAPETVNRLNLANQYKLIQYVETEYRKSGLTFVVFAKQAAEALGFPVTSGNISGCCEALNLPSNREVARDQTPATVLARLDRIEAVLKKLGIGEPS